MATSSAPIPPASLFFGYGPVLVLAICAAASWMFGSDIGEGAMLAGWGLGGALILFLAGVTRGLSFFTPGGPRFEQIAMMLWLFAIGVAGLLVPTLWLGALLFAIGFASIALFDPPAAHAGWAPAHFARLRPAQMAIAVLSELAIATRAFHVG